MTLSQLKKELIKEFRSSLSPGSKFFNEDMQSFSQRLKGENDRDRLIAQLSNLRCLNGKSRSFNNKVERFTNELDAAGMFDMGNMKPENALD